MHCLPRQVVLVGFIPNIEQISRECCTHLHQRSTGDVLTGWYGLPLETRITKSNLLEFALTVIKKFSQQSLDKCEIGPKAQSIPEAQFQDEFYSAIL